MARLALAQLPRRHRRRVLIRTDSGGGTHEFLAWLTGRRLRYSIGFAISEDMQEAILSLPERFGNLPMTRAARCGPVPGWRSSRG